MIYAEKGKKGVGKMTYEQVREASVMEFTDYLMMIYYMITEDFRLFVANFIMIGFFILIGFFAIYMTIQMDREAPLKLKKRIMIPLFVCVTVFAIGCKQDYLLETNPMKVNHHFYKKWRKEKLNPFIKTIPTSTYEVKEIIHINYKGTEEIKHAEVELLYVKNGKVNRYKGETNILFKKNETKKHFQYKLIEKDLGPGYKAGKKVNVTLTMPIKK